MDEVERARELLKRRAVPVRHVVGSVGDDWMLALFGTDDDGTAHYVVTDRMPGSEMPRSDPGGDADLFVLARTRLLSWLARLESAERVCAALEAESTDSRSMLVRAALAAWRVYNAQARE